MNDTVLQETSPRKKGSFLRLCAEFIFTLIFLYSGQFAVTRWLPDIPYLNAFLQIGAMFAMTCFLLRYFQASGNYTYRVDKNGVCFFRGKRTDSGPFLEIPWESILRLLPVVDLPKEKEFSVKRRKKYGVVDAKYAYALCCKTSGTAFTVIFQPSDEFVKKMKQFALDNGRKI